MIHIQTKIFQPTANDIETIAEIKPLFVRINTRRAPAPQRPPTGARGRTLGKEGTVAL